MRKPYGSGQSPEARVAGGLSLVMRAGCAAAIAACALTGSAYAATVHGADYHGTGSAIESGEVDVLDVDGAAGEKVFLTVKAHGRAIAQNLPYTIGENAQPGDGATWAGIATLDIDGLDLGELDGTYTIEAYASRAGGQPLYSGALYGVYADLPDGTEKLIGTRVANAAELGARPFEPAETLYANGRTFRLAGAASPAGAGVQHFAYEEYDEATTVDGVVKYVDAAGTTIATTKIAGLAYGEERRVDIPTVVTGDDGALYRTVFFKSSVTAVNPGSTSFSVYCAKMSEADQALAGYYVATIQMVDGNGRVIAADSVNVTGEFVYTAPSVIHKTEAAGSKGGQPEVVTYVIDGSPTVRLSAANDNVLTRERTVQVAYTAQAREASEASVTFNLIDGSKRVNEEGRALGTRQVTATEAQPTVEPPSTVEVEGATYRLVGEPGEYAYTLHSGAVPSVDAYYVPEGYQAPGAYDVTVNYVNFLTGAVVESHSYTSDPDQNSRITLDTPGEFSADGVDYVRLDGQEGAIAHSYYSGIDTYTVYYRDVNDVLSSETVINTIRVVYLDGPGAAAATTDEEAAAADAQALQLNGGRTYNVLDGGDNNATLTNEGGVDSNTERIEDSETPLASGYDRGGTSSAAASLMQVPAWLPYAGIAGAVLVAALAVIAVVRRRNNDRDEW